MSMERSFEAWEEVQRHGLDFADRLAQGLTGLVQSHMNPTSFQWPNQHKSKLFDLEFPTQSFVRKDFGVVLDKSGMNMDGVSAIFDIGNKIGQAGADFGAGFNGLVQQFFRSLPMPFRHDESMIVPVRSDMILTSQRADVSVVDKEGLGELKERLRGYGYAENHSASDEPVDEEVPGFNLRSAGVLGRPQGMINISSTYESRTRDLENSLVARGDLWRVEASNSSSTSGNENSSLFLVQLGPVLFVRDTTLLLPIHLSKQHLLWYGYDRKNGLHSLCPAVWSKHRRWLLMSMLCLNPLTCSFVDLQFPNGQVTYVSGEGVTTSAFLPVCGGLLQAQGQYPGEMRYSFSCKNKRGTRITPIVQWPDKSLSLCLSQALAWRRSGLMLKPSVQASLCPTFGGTNPGIRAEIIHTVRENLNLICGCALTANPSAFASVSLGRSKWNGNIGNSGMVLRADAPLSNFGRPSFSVQINNLIEF